MLTKQEALEAEAAANASKQDAPLRRGHRLARNTVLNLVGESVPILTALFAIPLLIRGLGTDRFGLLTIVWMVIGYFSLFDMGLGRALTKMVAEKLGSGQEEEIPAFVWTALLLMLVLGITGAAVVALVSPVLVFHVLKMPNGLRLETLHAFELLALSIPVVISSIGLRGVLEAMHRFDLTNAVRTPMGLFSMAGPLLVLPFSRSLVPIVAVLVVGRLVTCVIFLVLCLRVFPALRHKARLQRSAVRPLFHFGSWLTVSNIVSPLMTTFDRFIIGALVSAQAVAYYATPYDVTSKLLVIPAALVTVLFPTFSAEMCRDRARVTQIFGRAVKHVFLALFPATLILVALAHNGLQLWLGAEFARHGTVVLQLLAISVLINSLAFVPLALVEGAGRPDWTAKLHLAELPVYLITIWGLIQVRGIEGAAIASVARIAVDTVILFVMAHRLLRFRVPIRYVISLTSIATLALLGLGVITMAPEIRILVLLLVLAGFSGIAWRRLLMPDERAFITSRLRFSPSYAKTSSDT